MSGPATTRRSQGRDPGPSTPLPEALTPGVEVGRYVILSVAGSGGFGIVYRAYDPELDRSVALKHFSDGGGGGDTIANQVMREARALAKLRHPNIVAVYDTGTFSGRAFVAMEYVAGSDLDAWLLEKNRSWEEVAPLLADAAAGLHAAHVEGIVHRDFKPGNVLVSAQGRGYVADFGLAVVATDETTSTEGSHRPPGTPAYLAPELYSGEPATVRSDLYSLCVTIWEAAFSQRPWSATTEAALVEEKLRGAPSIPRPGVLPRPVAKLVQAGLSPDPSARPGSLAEIIEALTGRQRRKRWWVLSGGLVAAAIGVGVLAPKDQPCQSAAVALDAVWNAEVAQVLQQKFAQDAGAHGNETWDRTQGGIQRWEGRWREQRVDACEATHLRHEQSEALLDRRSRCFDRELQTLSVFLAVLREGGGQVRVRAPRAAEKLAAELDCSLATVQADGSPLSAEHVPMLADLDRVRVLETVAMYDEGLLLVGELEERAKTSGAAEIELRAKHRRARLLHATGAPDDAVRLYAQVHWDAEALGIDDLSAKAGIDAMFEYAAPLGEPEVALQWEPHVAAAIRRAGDQPSRRAALWDNRGIALLYSGKLQDALAAHQQALSVRESYDDEGFDTVVTLQNLGIVHEELEQYDRAIESQQRAHAILRRLLGDHHPDTARVRDNLGTAQLRSGDIVSATENFRGALDVRQSVLGPRHPSVALSHMHLALAALEGDAPVQAVEYYETALELLQASQPEGRKAALCHEGLAHSYRAAGNHAKAVTHAALALKALAPLLAADHPEILGLQAILDAPDR